MASSSRPKKKKSRPTNKKKSSKASQPRSLFPALFFLAAICSLIAIFYLYNNYNTINVKVLSGVSQSDDPTKYLPKTKPKKITGQSSQPVSLDYFRLENNFNQAIRLRKSFAQTLTQQQKAHKIIYLLSFPREGDQAPLPAKTKLLGTNFTPPTITIDLSRNLTNGTINFGARDEMLAIACLTNTFLLNFPAYEHVQILIEGQRIATLAGHIDISKPLSYQPAIDD